MGIIRIKISWNSVYIMLDLTINISLSYSPSSIYISRTFFNTNK
nr:MAG TPA: hypothetical protein [Bacteriophage sp.]